MAGTHPPPSRGPARGSGFVRPRGGASGLKPRAGPAPRVSRARRPGFRGRQGARATGAAAQARTRTARPTPWPGLKGSARPRRLAHARAGGLRPLGPPRQTGSSWNTSHALYSRRSGRVSVQAHPGGDSSLWVEKLKLRREPTVGFSPCTQVLAVQ